jgi:hypothetical protein
LIRQEQKLGTANASLGYKAGARAIKPQKRGPSAASAGAPFSDYEFEMDILEKDLEIEWELSSRAGETD